MIQFAMLRFGELGIKYTGNYLPFIYNLQTLNGFESTMMRIERENEHAFESRKYFKKVIQEIALDFYESWPLQ